MNWQNIHTIFDVLSKQTSVKKLNNLAITFCCEFLQRSTYRLYLMEAMQEGYILDVISYDGSPKPTNFEMAYINEVSEKGLVKKLFFEKDNHAFFSIAANRKCCALIVVNLDKESIPKSNYEILKTIVSVWNNQLQNLHYFQRDYLTGLYNREYFLDTINTDNFENYDDDITKILQTNSNGDARRSLHLMEASAIVLIKIKDFDSINAEFGYTIGDEVLISFGNLITLSFRTNDVYCRYSGDTFAVFIHQVSKISADSVIKRFLSRIRESNFPVVHDVDANIGYTFVSEGTLASELIAQARDALQLSMDKGNEFELFRPKHADEESDNNIKIGEIEFF